MQNSFSLWDGTSCYFQVSSAGCMCGSSADVDACSIISLADMIENLMRLKLPALDRDIFLV